MGESQNVEYKESWRDEYLKWVCGFANARGGRIFIGIRDDGTIVGVPDSKRLMEEIPNKIKDTIFFSRVSCIAGESSSEFSKMYILTSPSFGLTAALFETHSRTSSILYFPSLHFC